MYIGQTHNYYKTRWSQHKKEAFKKHRKSYNYPLYKSFRKYGIDNFEFKVIEICLIEELDAREIYWIKYYNTYSNGYNCTLGGKGKSVNQFDEDKIIEEYKETKNMSQISKAHNCSRNTIKNILLKNNVNLKAIKDNNKDKGFTILQYDKKFNLLRKFNSLHETGKWLETSLNKEHVDISTLRRAILNKIQLYGYYWDSPFYSNEKKEITIKNNKEIQKKYYNKSKNNKKEKCPICGKLKYKGTILCLDCENNRKRETAIKEKEKLGITREFLKQEIRNKPFTIIAKEQGVSDNTIRKWCKLFNLPYKSLEIKKYSDEDWSDI